MSEKRGKCVKREHILGKRIRKPEGERTDSHSPLRPQVADVLLLSPPNRLHSRGQEGSFQSHFLASLFAKETRTTFKHESYLILLCRILHWQENTWGCMRLSEWLSEVRGDTLTILLPKMKYFLFLSSSNSKKAYFILKAMNQTLTGLWYMTTTQLPNLDTSRKNQAPQK